MKTMNLGERSVNSMKNKIAKERVIYDNYNPWETYTDKAIREMAMDCRWVDSEEEITESLLQQWRDEEMEIDWETEKLMLDDYFYGKEVEFIGNVGLWHGVYEAKEKGDFWKLFDKAMKDCDYFRIYDTNGHLYLTCSHHDGTNHFEIKVVTDKGYTVLPRYAEKVFGCKAREYEPITKGGLINLLNNEAKSFYC